MGLARRAGRVGLRSFVAVVITGACAAAQAAEAPLSHNDPTRITPAPQAAPAAPLALPSVPQTAAPEDTAPRFVLRGARFDGASALAPARLRPAWAGYVGRSVSLADLRLIGHRAEAIYARAGFPFVAVLLKVQEVNDGVVRYAVTEGKISDLTILGSDPVARRQATAMLAPLVDRTPLSLSDVESAYVLARKVPGLFVNGALRRGEEAGGMDLVVTARRETWRAYVNVNNLYADPVGPWGVLVGADHFGSSEYGDTTSVAAYTSVPLGRQVLVRASHAQGLDSEGLTATVSALWGTADPKGSFTSLELATDIKALRLEVSQPLVERPNASLVATIALDVSDQRTLVYHVVGLSDDRLRTFSEGLAGELTGRFGRIAANLEVRKGLDLPGASHQGDADLSRVGGDPEALVFRGGVEGESASLAKIRLAFRIDAQQTRDALTAPDQYTVGNLTLGRGYQPGAALGDSALGGSLEARIGPYPVRPRLTAQPFAFVDAVRLWNNGAAAFGARTLSSLGGGVRFQVAGKLNLEIAYAAPQQAPLGVGDKRPGQSVLFNLTVGLNDLFSAIHRRLASGVRT